MASRGWRNARSLDVLTAEVRAVAPGTTVWTIGDEDHQSSWSDHNPNAAGVVCAADILGDAGLDLDALARTVTTVDPPALKYVIWQDRIWHPGYGWARYYGAYHSYVHVSVGWGPDGQSAGPYDDITPWGVMERMGRMAENWGPLPRPRALPEYVTIDTAMADVWAGLTAGTTGHGDPVDGWAIYERLDALRRELAETRAALDALTSSGGGSVEALAVTTQVRGVVREEIRAALADYAAGASSRVSK